jgi:hypothetical protein
LVVANVVGYLRPESEKRCCLQYNLVGIYNGLVAQALLIMIDGTSPWITYGTYRLIDDWVVFPCGSWCLDWCHTICPLSGHYLPILDLFQR